MSMMPSTPPVGVPAPPPSASQAAGWRPALLPALIACAAASYGVGNWAAITPDGIDYLSIASTLVEQQGLPDRYLHRPPGFSFLVLPLIWLDGPLPLLAIRLLAVVAHAATAVLAWRIATCHVGPRGSLCAGIAVALHPSLLAQATYVLSETVFMPLALTAILLVEKPAGGFSKRRALAAGSITAAAVFVRTMGLALVPVCAWAIARSHGSLPRRLMAVLIFLSAACLPAGLWQIRQSRYSDGHGYGRTWTHARAVERTDATGLALQAERLARFGPERLRDVKELLIPTRLGWRCYHPPLNAWTSALTGVAVLTCLIGLLLQFNSPAAAYALLSLAAVAPWPWHEGVRLVLPAAPIMIIAAAAGLLRLRRSQRGRVVGAAAGLLSVLLVIHICDGLRGLPQRVEDARRRSVRRIESMQNLADAIRPQVAPGRGVVCIVPQGRNAKTVFAGAAYLAGVEHVRFVDVLEGDTAEARTEAGATVFVHKALAPGEADVVMSAGDFVVLRSVP